MQAGKLVRDRIPDLIRAGGVEPLVRPIHGDELRDALFAKLAEEIEELRVADEATRAEELADVLEVVRALATHIGTDMQHVEQLAEQKRVERGGFASGLWLTA